MRISTVLDQIDLGAMALPEFQRGYVWNRDQVRGLMDSLYRRHPVGSLLVWVTKTEAAEARGDGPLTPGTVKLLLDGQQRVTSLYGIVRGKPPRFFEGNADAFSGLHFHLDEQAFEFYAPLKMKDNPLWINVTDLMQQGVGPFIQRLAQSPGMQANFDAYLNRLNAIGQIQAIDLHIEEVTGEDKTVDVVVDIFNRVNSGGTKLSKGDLALAKICAEWPQARDEMKRRLLKWRNAGFHFRLEWLLRCINTILTGEALFLYLKDVDTPAFQRGLQQAENAVDTLLNVIAGRLGLDHDRVLGSRYSFPLLARYLSQRGGHLTDHKERDKLLYWYVHTFLWGRYAGSTETVLNQDLALIEHPEEALDRLIEHLRRDRGDLRIRARDFEGWSQGARFYPLLYLLTRVCHSKDWGTGVELTSYLLGYLSRLELHHVFPKSRLYQYGYSRAEVNALANFTFLTQQTNLMVSNRDPEQYLAEIAERQPGALESHWIPMDRNLWKIENYREFLAARRELLAAAANQFLDSLLQGAVPETQVTTSVLDRQVEPVPGGQGGEDEEAVLLQCMEWVAQQGLPEGELMYELTHPETGAPLAMLDLAWPDGLQEGLSSPVALLIDEPQETLEIVNQAGYRYFTNLDAFRQYVREEILALEPVAA
jgi:hypothetical protein